LAYKQVVSFENLLTIPATNLLRNIPMPNFTEIGAVVWISIQDTHIHTLIDFYILDKFKGRFLSFLGLREEILEKYSRNI
jgi:hypothetical protein